MPRRSQADFPLIGLSEFGRPPLSKEPPQRETALKSHFADLARKYRMVVIRPLLLAAIILEWAVSTCLGLAHSQIRGANVEQEPLIAWVLAKQ
jgi:hypothetical protein